MQPYRIPLQPTSPLHCEGRSLVTGCEPTFPRAVPNPSPRPALFFAVILAALFAGSVPATLAMVLEHRGRVEIEPMVLENAVAKARKSNVAPVPAPASPPAPVYVLPNGASRAQPAFSILADGQTHDNMTLVYRARSLADAGAPITISFVDVNTRTRDQLRRGEGMPMRVVPVNDGAAGSCLVSGLRLGGIPEVSPLRDLGIQEGDVLVSINGYRPSDDIESVYDQSFRSKSGHATLELVRGPSRVVIDLWWSGG